MRLRGENSYCIFTVENMQYFRPKHVCIRKWNENEMNRALGHLCAHIGWTGPGEPPGDGEMIEMTLSSRHRIWNSRPGGLRSSTLPLGHGGSPQYWLSHVDGEETFFCFFQTAETGTEPRVLAWKAAVLTTTPGPPPICTRETWKHRVISWQNVRLPTDKMATWWVVHYIVSTLEPSGEWISYYHDICLFNLNLISRTNDYAFLSCHFIFLIYECQNQVCMLLTLQIGVYFWKS